MIQCMQAQLQLDPTMVGIGHLLLQIHAAVCGRERQAGDLDCPSYLL